MTPLPIWLSTQGILVSSTKRRSMLDVILRFAPAPITSSGCLHACAQAVKLHSFSVFCGKLCWLVLSLLEGQPLYH